MARLWNDSLMRKNVNQKDSFVNYFLEKQNNNKNKIQKNLLLSSAMLFLF